MADLTGVQWIDDFTGFVGGGLRANGQILGDTISSMPALAGAAVDYLSNMTVDDMLDVGQLGLDVVGMMPVVGEVADLANGAISLGRGNYADAAFSFAAMMPMAGSAVTATKWGKKIVGKADEVLAGAKWVKCKVTGTGCFVAGTKVWVSAAADSIDLSPLAPFSERQVEGEGLPSATAILESPTITKTAIESVAIGSRLAGENPQPWEYDDSLPEPVQADWSLVTFSMTREDGSEIEVEMIRPTSFWQQQGAVPGAQVFMEFPELEVSTHATVRKVKPCPAIAAGSGNVVTARIVTLTATDLVDVELETGEIITGTPPHPIWSVEEEDWVELGELEVGDFVRTDDGPVEVISVDYRTTAETVYNVEVHGHHVYQLGDVGVLVHNAGPGKYSKVRSFGKKSQKSLGQRNVPQKDEEKHCHGQTRNLRCAQTDSGTTDRVVFLGLKVQ